MDIKIGNIVYVSKSEEIWDKPFVMKRHHVYNTRSIILQVLVEDIKGNEFKGKLFDNNNFEKDGQTFVFNNNDLLASQNITDKTILGVWDKKLGYE